MKIKDYKKISKFSEVSGATAVVDDNITIRMNDYGLYQEYFNDENAEINDETLFVSPNFNNQLNESEVSKQLFGKDENIIFDKDLGYYQSLYVGYVKEQDFRKNGSSGGMGTWILYELFNKGLIDGVIHVKETKSKDILFKYDISKTIEEIKQGAKTKYYPVELSEVLKLVEKKPGRYAIVGIPSFIMSIRLLAIANPIFKERIKYTIGLVCGHQKSSKFAESMAWQVGIEPGNLTKIDFRHKLDGIASKYAVKFLGVVNGEEKQIIKQNTELLGQNWGSGYFKAFSSDYTDDVMNETADVVFGDAWLPEYTKDPEGNNIVIVRNKEIHDIIINAIDEDRLFLNKVDNKVIFDSQKAHFKHTRDDLGYRLLKLKNKNNWFPQKRVAPNNHGIPKARRKIQDLRQKISLASHEIYLKALNSNDFNLYYNEMNKLQKQYDRKYKILRLKQLTFKQVMKKIFNKFSFKQKG